MPRYRAYLLTLLLIVLVSVVRRVMQMMHAGVVMAGDGRHEGVIAQRGVRVVRMMMAEEPDRRRGGLMLSLLHALLYLALHLAQDRMMRRPSRQVERKHRRRPLEQSRRGQQGPSGGAGSAAGWQRKRQGASRLQDHLRYQLAGVLPPTLA